MREVETIIVGGGPAGSSCAWRLHRAGRECLVLDRKAMPRLKLCAGWITPKVLSDLELRADQVNRIFRITVLGLPMFGILLGLLIWWVRRS